MDGLILPALSGATEAARKKLDAVGVCVVAGVAAFGGGTLRDVLLDRRPLFWIEQSWYVWSVFLLCMAAMWLGLFAATAMLLRLAALQFEWRLPTWKLDGDD